ncbi:MAG: helix-turn-helix domain-containing protein [Actinobacteria bacterium]|nr:helix-turn-helix domain-containing protein [Actinomycetota bacterium]
MPLELSPEQRAHFEAAVRPATAERRIVQRAQAALLMADGVPASDISMLIGIHHRTVEKWRARFDCANPMEKLADAPRSGRPPSLSRRRIARE